MVPLLVGAQVLTLICMVAVSVWGRKNIADETRTRARVGTAGFDYTKSKSTTLVYTPVVGLLIVAATVAVIDTDAPEAMASIGLAIMVFFLAAHWSAVKRAAR